MNIARIGANDGPTKTFRNYYTKKDQRRKVNEVENRPRKKKPWP